MREEEKEKVIHMMNGGKLKSKRGDIAFYDKSSEEFVIDFDCCESNGRYERLYFKYLSTFEKIA